MMFVQESGRKAVMVSVVIPSYNCGEYISQTLASVMDQTYRDFEVIVVDDGSTDETADIIAGNFPGVRYYRTPNQGVSKARNVGIDKSRGQFIAFLDADDLWLPEKLEKQIRAFQADPDLMMVFTENQCFDEVGFVKRAFSKRERLMKGDVVKNIFFHSNVATSTVMVRRGVFDKIGVFEEDLRTAEDDNLWLRIAFNFRIALIDEILIHYRLTSNSLSRSTNNIFDGVTRHLELLEVKYPELSGHLGRASIRQKKSDLYFLRATIFFHSAIGIGSEVSTEIISLPSEKKGLALFILLIPARGYSRKNQED